MRRAFADFSPAVPAAFAAGLGVALWIFLLPAGVVQKGPTPRLPAFGGAAGRVTADLAVPARPRASEVSKPVPSAHPQRVVALPPPTVRTRHVHHRARAGMVRRPSPAPVREVPGTRSELFSIPPKAKGKARGHERGNASEPKAETPAPHPPGHRKALGRSNEREDRVPPGRAKKASRASAPGLPRPQKGHGRGNERKGNDRGNRGKGEGDGDGHGGDEK
jgi:hypothetical protein